MHIKKTNTLDNHYTCSLIIAPSGAGKTTLASTLEGSTIIYSAESGLLSLHDFEIDYIEQNKKDPLNHFGEFLTWVINTDYDNVFIDSVTEIGEQLVEDEKEDGFKKWGNIKDKLTRLIKYCRDMEKNVYFTALVKVDKDETTGRRYLRPDIPTKLAEKAPAYFDQVYYLEVAKKEDKLIRTLLTQSTDNKLAKDRSGKLDKYEPADLGKIHRKIFTKGD